MNRTISALAHVIAQLDWRDIFIADLKRSQNVKVAAALAGVRVETAHIERSHNSEFARRWAVAMADKTSRLSKLDRQVLRHIDAYICEHGNSPSQHDLAQWLGQKTRGYSTGKWLARMCAIDEIVVTQPGESLKSWLCWTRPWVLKLLAARQAKLKGI